MSKNYNTNNHLLVFNRSNELDGKKVENCMRYLELSILSTFGINQLIKINPMMSSKNVEIDFIYLQKKEVVDYILSHNYNFKIVLSVKTVVDELLESYREKYETDTCNSLIKNIMSQIKIDFPRMDVYYNNVKLDDLNIFLSKIGKFKTCETLTTKSLYYLLIMLCTQASFYYPYKLLSDLYTRHENNMCILSSNDTPLINLIEKNENISIVLKKIVKYKNIDKNVLITNIHTFTTFNITLKYDQYGYTEISCITCSIYWIKEANIVVI